MFKSISILICVVAASYGGLIGNVVNTANTLPNLPVVPVPVVTTSTIAPAVNSELSSVGNTATNALFNGATVDNPLGNGTFMIGEMALPVNALCVDTSVTNLVTCHVCFQDCLYVHNRYGGQCQFNTVANEQRCTCYDNAFPTDANNQPINTALGLCGPLPGGEAAALLASSESSESSTLTELNILADEAIRLAFVARYDYLQCSAALASATGTNINNGCNADCTRNHQYIANYPLYGFGRCAYQVAVAPGASSTPQPFCTCGYGTSTTTY
jgi:hypothetical protein